MFIVCSHQYSADWSHFLAMIRSSCRRLSTVRYLQPSIKWEYVWRTKLQTNENLECSQLVWQLQIWMICIVRQSHGFFDRQPKSKTDYCVPAILIKNFFCGDRQNMVFYALCHQNEMKYWNSVLSIWDRCLSRIVLKVESHRVVRCELRWRHFETGMLDSVLILHRQ